MVHAVGSRSATGPTGAASAAVEAAAAGSALHLRAGRAAMRRPTDRRLIAAGVTHVARWHSEAGTPHLTGCADGRRVPVGHQPLRPGCNGRGRSVVQLRRRAPPGACAAGVPRARPSLALRSRRRRVRERGPHARIEARPIGHVDAALAARLAAPLAAPAIFRPHRLAALMARAAEPPPARFLRRYSRWRQFAQRTAPRRMACTDSVAWQSMHGGTVSSGVRSPASWPRHARHRSQPRAASAGATDAPHLRQRGPLN